MASSDLDTLVDMGFDKERAELAVKHTGGLQGAIDWLDANQEKSIDDIKASTSANEVSEASKDEVEEGAPANPAAGSEEARSLVCNDCSKRFRSHAQAEFHASKTEHVDFSESTEELAPLTEEEKKAKLAHLREQANLRKAAQAKEDLVANKRNEAIRRKADQAAADAKEALAKKEQLKHAQAQRQEKLDEVAAKKRIQAKIAADKEERRIKAEKEKAARAGQVYTEAEQAPAAAPASQAPAATKTHDSARLRLSHPNGTTQLTLPAETTLFELAHQLSTETGGAVEAQTFTATFGARKTWTKGDFGMTVKEVGWVPSAAVVVR